MEPARRAFDIIRGYVNHGWESLTGSDETEAERELREAIEKPAKTVESSGRPEAAEPKVEMTIEAARTLYGVKESCTSKQITAAYEELRITADPTRFPEGSEARSRANQLMQRIVCGRQVLLDNLDPTVRRFEGLEIE